jgi:hypothetical protein
MRTMKMKSLFLIGMCGVLSVLQAQNDSVAKTIDILPWDQSTLSNEICIQNFFPMFFQNGWGGISSVMYRRYFRSLENLPFVQELMELSITRVEMHSTTTIWLCLFLMNSTT